MLSPFLHAQESGSEAGMLSRELGPQIVMLISLRLAFWVGTYYWIAPENSISEFIIVLIRPEAACQNLNSVRTHLLGTYWVVNYWDQKFLWLKHIEDLQITWLEKLEASF